jgi:DNA polymerase I-like protein with 3'-5' exonuclease and polymerase domains
MSGLELRCLAHYLARYDKGEYASVIEQGDIHQFNADKMGVKRSTGKGIMYATLYGAGDLKIGSLVGGGKKDGRELRAMLEKGIPALKRLKNAIKKHLEKESWLPAIDGRRLPIRSEHSALNLLLQSAGSILMKRATVLMHDRFGSMDVQQLMHIHDEVQLQAKESEADYVGQLAVHAMRESGEHYDFRCKITGEYKIGRNWSDTH